jgi:hypothetical protein
MEIIDNIPISIEKETVIGALKLSRKNSSIEKIVAELLKKTEAVSRPKAVYSEFYIEEKSEDSVRINGVIFKSKILRKILENTEKVFPYIVTAGTELEQIEPERDDYMKVFCFDAIKELVLEHALDYVERLIAETHALTNTAHMNPGSLSDWPISEQKLLFSLFGDVKALIGVKLTERFLMDPIKSVSGFYFPTEIHFKSCMLCTRHPCVKRRAEYDPEMVKKYR